MFELTINGEVYQFSFNMGFLRAINKTAVVAVQGAPNVKKNAGLSFAVASIIDGDVESLVDVLFMANHGQNPRVTKALLEAYIDDETTDIDELFSMVLDFLERNNATRKVTLALKEEVAKNRESK